MYSVAKSSSEEFLESAVDLSNLMLSVLSEVQKKGLIDMLKNGLLLVEVCTAMR
jgi:predicted transcriptional regulator of viral defense system